MHPVWMITDQQLKYEIEYNMPITGKKLAKMACLNNDKNHPFSFPLPVICSWKYCFHIIIPNDEKVFYQGCFME